MLYLLCVIVAYVRTTNKGGLLSNVYQLYEERERSN